MLGVYLCTTCGMMHGTGKECPTEVRRRNKRGKK